MLTLDQQFESIRPQLLALVVGLRPPRRWWVVCDGEPVSDATYKTEEAALSQCHGRNHREPCLEYLSLTVGFTAESPKADCSFGWQTGDNSFTGGAYGHPDWAVVELDADSNPADVVTDILDQLGELIAQSE